ncbi:gluconokinase [Microbacterium sp.]|uniref:gluconokinase n=1 Tax=Microbacterium sp. TaxID=51671 RepID=UPI0025E17347|nr:gluconokinase [Microbacterium sp.]
MTDGRTTRADAEGVSRLIVMGPSGAGKSVIGAALAARLGVPFVDGDDLHPPANVAKMTAGHPLTDDDRMPWLDAVAAQACAPAGGAVLACSALARRYRDRILRGCASARFVELRVPRGELEHRMTTREHFMPPALLDSQLALWEELEPDEPGVSVVNEGSVEAVVDRIRRELARR